MTWLAGKSPELATNGRKAKKHKGRSNPGAKLGPNLQFRPSWFWPFGRPACLTELSQPHLTIWLSISVSLSPLGQGVRGPSWLAGCLTGWRWLPPVDSCQWQGAKHSFVIQRLPFVLFFPGGHCLLLGCSQDIRQRRVLERWLLLHLVAGIAGNYCCWSSDLCRRLRAESPAAQWQVARGKWQVH